MLSSPPDIVSNTLHFHQDIHQPTTQSETNYEQLQSLITTSSEQINVYEKQIAKLQQSIEECNNTSAQTKDVFINESHFWFKKFTRKGEREIVIQSQYLQDGIFDMIHREHQEEIDKLFVEAKGEIDRLTSILLERDDEILYLKNEIQRSNIVLLSKNQQSTNTQFDIERYLQNFQKLESENKRMQSKIKQLTTDLTNSVRKSQSNQDRSTTATVLRISANKPVVKQSPSLTSSGVSVPIKQKKDTEIQTENDAASHDIMNQLIHRRKQIQALNQQFEALKNDNFLFLEDLNVAKVRIQELQKIVEVQNHHIQTLREEGKTDKIEQNNQNNSELNIQIKSLNNKIHELNRAGQKLTKQNQTLQNKIRDIDGQLDTILSINTNLEETLIQIKQTNQSLLTKQSQMLENISALTHQYNIKEQENQVFAQEDKRLRAHIQEQEQSFHKLKLQELQWNTLRLKLEKELKNKASESRSKINDVKQEVDQKTLEILRNQLKEKSQQIEQLKTKINQLEKSISVYKNQIENKTSKGVVGLGTSNTLNQRSPQKFLQQIKTTEELVETARELINNKSNNLQKMYFVLDLLTEEFELLREELFKVNETKQNEHNTSVYEHETNNYIETLLEKIADHESEEERLYVQNTKLKAQLDRMSLLYRGQDYKDWQDLLNQLQFQRKLTQKLSNHVKTLKQQIFNLTAKLTRTNEQLYLLSHRPHNVPYDLRDIDRHLSSITNGYQKLRELNHNRSYSYESQDPGQLLDEIELYRLELQKAVNVNEQLKSLLNNRACSFCEQYQAIINDLQSKLDHYESMTIGEMKKLFNNYERQISTNNRSDIDVRINNLKERNHQQRYSEKGFQRSRNDSPSVKKYTNIVLRRNQKVDLKHLIEGEKLTLEALLIIMYKVIKLADNEMLYLQRDPVLPEQIQLQNYDRINPQNIKIHIIQSLGSNNSKNNLFLSPERLKGCQPTRKSLVWNIGIIFHLLVNKKPSFNSQLQIIQNSYKYQNKLFPELKPILQSMLQRDPSRRKLFSQVQVIVDNQLSRYRILCSRQQVY